MSEEKKKIQDEELQDVSGGVEYQQRQRAGNLTGFRSDGEGGPDADNLD